MKGIDIPDEIVYEMRELWIKGWRQKDIAELYGYSKSAIHNIVYGNTHTDVASSWDIRDRLLKGGTA